MDKAGFSSRARRRCLPHPSREEVDEALACLQHLLTHVLRHGLSKGTDRDHSVPLIIAAEYDTLRDEAEAYAQRLMGASVATRYICAPGMVHGFLQMRGIVSDADSAVEAIAEALADSRPGLSSGEVRRSR